MAQLDISGITYFTPVFSFVFVFVIIYSLLAKTKILGGVKWVDGIVGFIIAVIFATLTSSREYVEVVTPWFMVIVIALFFILIIVGLSQQKLDAIIKPWFVWVFIVAIILVFLISALNQFSSISYAWDSLIEFFDEQAKFAGAITFYYCGDCRRNFSEEVKKFEDN